MAKIKTIKAREIIISQANPTIETYVELQDGSQATASIPIGLNPGEYESFSIFEKDQNEKIINVKKAVLNVNEIIAEKIIGMDGAKQQIIDRLLIELDGTQNKMKLGANAMLSVSIAIAKASAKSARMPLFLYLREFISKTNQIKIPTIIFSFIEQSFKKYALVNFQEFFLIIPSSLGYENSLQTYIKIRTKLEEYLNENQNNFSISDKGGFFLKDLNNFQILEIIKKIVDNAVLQLGFDIFLGIDAAADNFYEKGKYKISDNESFIDADKLISYYQKLTSDYHILYLEDPLYEQDLESWKNLTKLISKTTIVSSDKMTSSNLYRFQMALEKNAITGLSIKPIQIGTVIEALALSEVARSAGIKTIVSARTFETNDDFIADFAVAIGADYVEFGAPTKGEHFAKYNRLSQISQWILSLKKLTTV